MIKGLILDVFSSSQIFPSPIRRSINNCLCLKHADGLKLLFYYFYIVTHFILFIYLFEFSMYTLYERFLQQLKKEQITKYNQKHRDYLIRCGKIKDLKPQKENSRSMNRAANHVRPKKEQTNQENMEDQITVVRQTINYGNKNDQRPLKGAQNYKIDTIELNTQAEHTLRPAKKMQIEFKPRQINKRPIQNTTKPQIQPVRMEVKPQLIEEKIIPKLAPTNNQQPEEFEQIVLVQCPQGCGKKFKQSVLQKHIKLCQKGEKKRKVFKVKIVDQQAQQLKKQEPKPKHDQQKKQQIPKWKKQSNQLRNVVNITKSLANGAPPPPPLQEQDDRIECQGCGRKFKEIVAQKHIPNCIKRNKGKK